MNDGHGVQVGVPKIASRARDGHKGTFGTVVVIGGCCAGAVRMLGAPALAAAGALRVGCGLVKMMVPGPMVVPALSLAPSATGIALPVNGAGELVGHEAVALFDDVVKSADAVVIGCGLGGYSESHSDAAHGAGVQALVLRALQQTRVPVVVDADALNVMSQIADLSRDFRASCILTPHVGEFRRLAASLNIESNLDASVQSAAALAASRAAACEALAQRLGCIVALKGAGTVVSNGHDSWVCGRGHSCMGTGGTGDVLAGLLGGLVAQWKAGGLVRAGVSRTGDVNSGVSSASGSTGAARMPVATDAEHPSLARVMSKDELMALAATRMGKKAPVASASAEISKRDDAVKPLTLLELACLGVEVHARAGEAWAKQQGVEAGMLASELAGLIPKVLQDLRSQ
ncbi:MAG: NAD(P)H-hydrate dehydratase [Phycisphaerales bacterium]